MLMTGADPGTRSLTRCGWWAPNALVVAQHEDDRVTCPRCIEKMALRVELVLGWK